MQQLKVGSSLQGGKYKIEKVLGQGGFGITYLATQELLDRKVCIKEFFFKEYCERNEATSHVTLGTQSNHELVERFMTKFLKEARTISQLEHPHIIRIHDIFKENNTAYYVMEYIEGESLADRVNHYGRLPESEAVEYIKQIASALDFIHQQSINHLDVKPANIMIRKSDNKAVLIDFGLSKQYDSQGGQTSTTPVGISHGYAPMEQYNVGGVSTFSPQTDIYSLGATLYKLVTGNTPPQAGEVLNEGLPELPFALSTNVKNVINQAMQVRKRDRPEDVRAFLVLLDTSTSAVSNEETKIVQPQVKSIEDEATMIFNKLEVKEKVYSARCVDDSSKPKISFEPEVKEVKNKTSNKLTYIVVGIFAVALLWGMLGNNHNHEYTSNSVQQSSQTVTYNQTTQVNNNTPQKQVQKPVTKGVLNGHEYVDLGLSVKWATCNIDALYPSDYGEYYAWGENEVKEFYGEDNYKWKGKSGIQLIDIKVVGVDLSLLPKYDVATQKWGVGWRMPTLRELKELRELCTWKWKSINDNFGFEVTGPNGESIFLPASGFKGNYAHRGLDSHGNYWSSTVQQYMYVDKDNVDWRDDSEYPGSGYNVRPVTE